MTFPITPGHEAAGAIAAVELPRFPSVSAEKSHFGSFWGNYNDLNEVLSLAGKGLSKHAAVPVRLEESTTNVAAMARGDVVGRFVIVYD